MTEITVTMQVTPEWLAEQFMRLDSEKQADFFAAMYRMDKANTWSMCMQTAWMVDEIASRQAKGDHDAANGFRTLFSHAESYIEVLVNQVSYLPMSGRRAR